jgi:hypothetical protein
MKVYEQQHHKAYDDAKVPIKDRIVSLSKPYIRPIIRGKEIKAVEFGAKVNKLQVDGISFIERFSYDAFNEGITNLILYFNSRVQTNYDISTRGTLNLRLSFCSSAIPFYSTNILKFQIRNLI